ncbi:MAG: AIR carboxylase family protein, partial [Chloroflexi bacterium]
MSADRASRVGIVVGSRSDIAAAEKAAAVLAELGVASETRVISAHRA